MILEKVYESVCNECVNIFCEKQEMSNEGWVGDEIGGIACCSDFYFNLHDIILDIKNKQPKGLIIDWYYSCLDNPEKTINYKSYTMGLRFEDIL